MPPAAALAPTPLATSAPRADLFARRDAAPSGGGRIAEAALADGGTLFLVPCSTTARDTVAVAVLVRDGRPQLLGFPAPAGARPGGGEATRVLILSPSFDAATGILTERAHRTGAGETVTRYRIGSDGVPALLEYGVRPAACPPILPPAAGRDTAGRRRGS